MQETVVIDDTLVSIIQERMRYTVADKSSAHDTFLQNYPSYHETAELDAMRDTEYNRLDRLNQVYLDYTGGGLYASSQLQAHMQLLMEGVYGNPHSVNPTSMAATELNDRARRYVCQYFNADPDEYIVVFTSNASGALRIVGEAYPFDQNGQYLLTFDNHNSVNGIREFARGKGAPVTYSPVLPPNLRIDEATLVANLDNATPGGNNLFAYPAQSNFSGVQHPLDWIEIAHEKGWDVLVDCAAFAPTNHLDLSKHKPDFVALSFYKMFGYPTGVGALIARRAILPKLQRPWFAGGTITIASVQGDTHFLEEDEAAYEDGTIDYLNLPAVEIGLRHLEKIGIDQIHERVLCLTGYLLDELMDMEHQNGTKLIKVYGPIDTEDRGGTIAMNFYDADGGIIDYRFIENLANEVNISLRTGCFCNPGAGELAFNIHRDHIVDSLKDEERMSFEEFVVVMTTNHSDIEAVGAVRVSVGLATNFADVYHFVQFTRSLLNIEFEQFTAGTL